MTFNIAWAVVARSVVAARGLKVARWYIMTRKRDRIIIVWSRVHTRSFDIHETTAVLLKLIIVPQLLSPMSPRLRVLAGTNPNAMVSINSIVNTSKAYPIHSDLFQGEIVANIKGMTDEHGRVRDSEYFRREEKQGVTWSIQVQGRFFFFVF